MLYSYVLAEIDSTTVPINKRLRKKNRPYMMLVENIKRI